MPLRAVYQQTFTSSLNEAGLNLLENLWGKWKTFSLKKTPTTRNTKLNSNTNQRVFLQLFVNAKGVGSAQVIQNSEDRDNSWLWCFRITNPIRASAHSPKEKNKRKKKKRSNEKKKKQKPKSSSFSFCKAAETKLQTFVPPVFGDFFSKAF